MPVELAHARREYIKAINRLAFESDTRLMAMFYSQMVDELERRPFFIYSILRAGEDAKEKADRGMVPDKFIIV